MVSPSQGRALGMWTLVALVVGNAIGAGIYTTSGFSLSALGSPEWVLLAWFIAGLIALCGAVSYGMLVQGIQESGGEYLFLSRSIHPLAGFVAGWISLLAGFPGAIAFAASALQEYLSSALPMFDAFAKDSIAVSAVILAGLIHVFHTRGGAKIHEWIVATMLGLLVLLILWSAFEFSSNSKLPVVQETPLAPFSIFVFANSLVWISLSYAGFNAAAYVAGEVKDAATVVPRGMIIGTLLTIVICVSVNAIVLYSSSYAQLAGQAEIAAIAAQSLGGETGRRVVEVIIALSLLTSITAMAMAGPRVYSKMAEDGALPKIFAAREGKPPRASIVLQIAISLVLILIADLRELLSYLGLTLSLCLALAVSSLFVRHYRLGERPNSAWYPFAPLAFVVCTVVFAVLSAINEPAQIIAVIPTLLMGGVAYLLSRWFGRPDKMLD